MVQKPFYEIIKRILDVAVASISLFVFAIPLLVISIVIKLSSPGPIIHWSKRIGKDNKIFLMAKFRTMRIDAPQVATHLMKDPFVYVTNIGSFLRKYSLDELPQLLNIIKGDISVVGPRPALYNQDDLITLRVEKNVHLVIPGLTGWAQVNGRDELPIPVKVMFDEEYCMKRSILFDVAIVFATIVKVFKSEGVSH
jgi:O-antigen biosynthesis protein WbqP